MSEFDGHSRGDAAAANEWMPTRLIPRSEIMGTFRGGDAAEHGSMNGSAADTAETSGPVVGVEVSDGDDDGADVGRDDSGDGAVDGLAVDGPAVGVPLPPSFFPTSSGRIRPSAVAAIRAEARNRSDESDEADAAGAAAADSDSVRSSGGSPTGHDNGADVGTSDGVSDRSLNAVLGDGSSRRAPRIRYSSQYHALPNR